MTSVVIAGVGVCAVGMAQWQIAKAVLRGDASWQPEPLPKLDLPLLPVTERRRVNAASRIAIRAALEAVANVPAAELTVLASVFASADGDGQVLASTLNTLAEDATAMSPTLFHNSVFNAPAGYWTIATRSRAPSTTVSAGAGSFAAGLLAAAVDVAAWNRPVLLVAADMPFPAPLQSFAVTGDAFACALLLDPPGTRRAAAHGTVSVSLRHEARTIADDDDLGTARPIAAQFAGNAAAAALPLLAAIACAKALRATLCYVDDCSVDLDYQP